ncbi:glycosyltransferase family 4 protein [Anaerocolumna chitinilytica]|uniref:Glycosyltransferase family 1 (GT1) n=1 Tax=Anaerocolumna chitinilytica TaxID=1727145 RepID=A0A7I8DJC0_9FIRM|nr:glycosyltransferase family 4 protein [Anaerocolumna chitinilytica]BCJ97361.1 glycosyltransferase family 1 (GT1) [Anaerocolumna chitinilytica]
MKICFVLPQMLKKPIGGYKMVYEYANRLKKEGHDIGILFLNENALKKYKLPYIIRYVAVEIFTRIEPRWFILDKKVKKYNSLEKKNYKEINSYDLVIATGVDTVMFSNQKFNKARKAYFIQGYEKWICSETELIRTYAMGMDNIVVSSWMKDIVDKYGKKPALLLQNPIDLNVYKELTPIDKRESFSVGVLYHKAKCKGFKYAYEALLQVKKELPNLKVYMFGTTVPDFDLPEWFDFTLNASQNETVNIYNKISIFLCSTIEEGFGLTGLEAMACGAALVSTDYNGVIEYAVDGINCLLSPVGDSVLLAKKVIELVYNQELRLKIARKGIESVKSFSWDNAMNILNDYLRTVEIVDNERD